MARTPPSIKRATRAETKESVDDTLSRVQGEKAFFDEQRKRGTYNRRRRATIEKKVRG